MIGRCRGRRLVDDVALGQRLQGFAVTPQVAEDIAQRVLQVRHVVAAVAGGLALQGDGAAHDRFCGSRIAQLEQCIGARAQQVDAQRRFGGHAAAVGEGDALVDDLQRALVIAIERQHRGQRLAGVDHHVARRVPRTARQREYLQPFLFRLLVIAAAVVGEPELIVDIQLLRRIVGCKPVAQACRAPRHRQRFLAAFQRAQRARVVVEVAGQR